MVQIIGVTELQRRFKSYFDQVVDKHTPIVLTRGSRPEAVLIPYEEYMRLRTLSEADVLADFGRVWNRLSAVNAEFSNEEVAADIKVARLE